MNNILQNKHFITGLKIPSYVALYYKWKQMNIRLSGQRQSHDWVYSTLNGLAISHSISIIKGSQCPNSLIFRWSKSRGCTVRQKPQNGKENQRRIGISQRSCSQSCSEVQKQPFCLSESVQLSDTQRDSFSGKVTVRNRVKQKERSVSLSYSLSLSRPFPA